MPAALDLLANGAAFIAGQFGSTACVIESLGVSQANWNDIGAAETLEINGRRITISAVVEFQRAEHPAKTAAQFHALAGKLITRSADGALFRIVGEISVDELAVRFPIASAKKA